MSEFGFPMYFQVYYLVEVPEVVNYAGTLYMEQVSLVRQVCNTCTLPLSDEGAFVCVAGQRQVRCS